MVCPKRPKPSKQLLIDHDGLLIASPEYNGSVSAALKNAIDWASRSDSKDETPLAAFRGKVASIMAASPGGLGGLRGLVHLRSILSNIQVLVLPQQLAVGQAHEAFDADGQLVNETFARNLESMAQGLVRTTDSLRS